MLGKVSLCIGALYILSQICVEARYQKEKVHVSKKFLAEGIVPYVVEDTPNYTLMVSFPNDVKVYPGIMLTYLEVVKPQPTARWRASQGVGHYTLIMISPDIPRYELAYLDYAEWHPWIVRNIPGYRLKGGETILPWNIPEIPRRKEESFFVVFLLFKQEGLITKKDDFYGLDKKLLNSGKFRVREYIEYHNFSAPEAGTYFLLTYLTLTEISQPEDLGEDRSTAYEEE